MTNVGDQKNFIIVSDQRIIPIPEALEQKIVKMSKKIQRYLYCFEKKNLRPFIKFGKENFSVRSNPNITNFQLLQT